MCLISFLKILIVKCVFTVYRDPIYFFFFLNDDSYVNLKRNVTQTTSYWVTPYAYYPKLLGFEIIRTDHVFKFYEVTVTILPDLEGSIKID